VKSCQKPNCPASDSFAENFIPPIRDGAKELVEELSEEFNIKLFTTRNKLLASKWVCENNLDKYITDVTDVKEPAWLYVDDRCMTFTGNFKNSCKNIRFFNPWYRS
jgi:hypothetical protein